MGKPGGKKKKSGVNQNKNQNQVAGDNNPQPIVNGGIALDSSIFLTRANELKEESNKKFQAKDYVGALQEYGNALKLTLKTHPERAVQPQFVRALFRRACAFEAIGKYEMALHDVQALLGCDPNHRYALEIARRLRNALVARQEAQQDLQSRPSPAALVPKKAAASSVVLPNNKPDKTHPTLPSENGFEVKTHLPKLVLNSSNGSSKPNGNLVKDSQKGQIFSTSISLPTHGQPPKGPTHWRSLKLVYDHDIRLAQMPLNCSFKVLREIVSKRFPLSKSVLVKYKDNDGDLVTITCTTELRFAESCVDSLIPKEAETDKGDLIGMLRLHIVEVSPEQEPPLLEEEEKPLESEGIKGEDTVPEEKPTASEDPEFKEMEMDDWLFEFAQLFRTHVGVDLDEHIDMHELGMELCSEALEEIVTSEEAQSLF
ncbi:hypothetical protein LguiA_025429 [Lonicera macranthoides]